MVNFSNLFYIKILLQLVNLWYMSVILINKILVFSTCGLFMGTKKEGGELNDGAETPKDVDCAAPVAGDGEKGALVRVTAI